MPARQIPGVGGKPLNKGAAATGQGREPKQLAAAGADGQQGPLAQPLVATFHTEPPRLRVRGIVAVKLKEIHGVEAHLLRVDLTGVNAAAPRAG